MARVKEIEAYGPLVTLPPPYDTSPTITHFIHCLPEKTTDGTRKCPMGSSLLSTLVPWGVLGGGVARPRPRATPGPQHPHDGTRGESRWHAPFAPLIPLRWGVEGRHSGPAVASEESARGPRVTLPPPHRATHHSLR